LPNRQGVRDLGPNPALATYVGAALLGGVVGAAITGKSEGQSGWVWGCSSPH
jgi:hypothetical protein